MRPNLSARCSHTFKASIYNKYLDIVESQLQRCFPTTDLTEILSVFDGKSWPEHPLITLATQITAVLIKWQGTKGERDLL